MTMNMQNILIIGEAKIFMDAPVKQRLELGSLTIVRVYPDDEELNSYPQEKLNRNVYAYDSLGKLLWQIQKAPHGGVEDDKAYMDIKIVGGYLVAGNWIGVDYQVNLESGRVLPLKQGARPW